MNLHAIVSGAIGAINPPVPVTLRASTGYTIGDDGKQIPAYAADATVLAQVQELTYRDLMQIEALNLQGVDMVVYLSGFASGIVRASGKGGDLIIMSTGVVWLVTEVLEQWPDWTKVSVTMQNNQ